MVFDVLELFFKKRTKDITVGGVPVKDLSVNPNSYIDSDPIEVRGYTGGQISVKATFDSGATAGLRLIYLYSQDGSNWDDEQEAINEGNYTDIGYDESGNFVKAGSSSQRSPIIPIVAPFVIIRFKNLDSTYPVKINQAKITLTR